MANSVASENEIDKYIEAVVQIIKLTQEGKMVWEVSSTPEAVFTSGTDLNVYEKTHAKALEILRETTNALYQQTDTFYVCKYKENRYVLTKTTFRHPVSETTLKVTATLSLITKQNLRFNFPNLEVMNDLLRSVEKKPLNSDVDSALQSLFQD